MGRCCSLSTRSTCRNPRSTAPTATVLPYTYSTPYPMLEFICNIYYYHQQRFSVPYPCNSNPNKHSVYQLNCFCLYHLMSVYTLCTSTKCMLCTTLVVLWFCHTTLPPSPLPISTRPTSSRWVPP